MRTPRRLFLLLAIASSVLCFADQKDPQGRTCCAASVSRNKAALSQNPDGTFQFHILPPADTPRQFSLSAVRIKVVKHFKGGILIGGVGYYYIDTYKRKRLDNTDETVPAGETTCTPGSHLHFKPLQP